MTDTGGMVRTSILSLPLVLIVACGGSSGSNATGDQGNPLALAEFVLHDINLTSPTYNTDVSPRDFLGSVSAWYFGEST